MLKRLFLFLIVLISACSSAQSLYFEGFRAGLNVSTITHSDFGYRPGFYGSALATLKFKEFYAMQFEGGYSNQGASGTKTVYTLTRPRLGDPDIYRVTRYHDPVLHYLTLGVMNRFTIAPKFYGYIGASAEFLMAHADIYSNDGDFVWNLGFTYDVTDKLAVEIRAKKGMLSLISDSYDYRNDDDDIHGIDITNNNLAFQVGLIYKLHFTYTDVKNLIKK